MVLEADRPQEQEEEKSITIIAVDLDTIEAEIPPEAELAEAILKEGGIIAERVLSYLAEEKIRLYHGRALYLHCAHQEDYRDEHMPDRGNHVRVLMTRGSTEEGRTIDLTHVYHYPQTTGTEFVPLYSKVQNLYHSIVFLMMMTIQ